MRAEQELRSAARTKRRLEEARRLYEERWSKLLEQLREVGSARDESGLRFEDIPWPIFPTRKSKEGRRFELEDFTKEAIESFLSISGNAENEGSEGNVVMKDAVRATMLRFHPDKFESRILVRVREKDRGLVQEVANIVTRVLNELSQRFRNV